MRWFWAWEYYIQKQRQTRRCLLKFVHGNDHQVSNPMYNLCKHLTTKGFLVRRRFFVPNLCQFRTASYHQPLIVFPHSGHLTSSSKSKLLATNAPQCGHLTTSEPIMASNSRNSSRGSSIIPFSIISLGSGSLSGRQAASGRFDKNPFQNAASLS